MAEITLRPIGIIRNDIKKPSLLIHSGDLNWEDPDRQPSHPTANISEIVVDPGYAGILDGIEEYSHLLVLYWAHLVDDDGRTITKTHPAGRKDLPMVGVFASCSPARPNPVLVMPVRLLERNDYTLQVEGLDAIDGSPVVDIKPYLPLYYSIEKVKLAAWMNQMVEEKQKRQ